MSETLKKIQELEQKAIKYDELKEIFDTQINKIFKLTEEIQKEIEDINPFLKLKKKNKKESYGKRNERVEQLFNELKENDSMQITLSDIERRFDLSPTGAQLLATDLKKCNGIMTRLDGKRLFIYYFKSKVDKDNIELSENTKVQSKISYMR